jgi:Ca2+-binding EF-hand superfamily protein
MDKNQDGGITPDELSSTEMLYEHFSVADADGNGQLSADEIVKHRADMAAAPQGQ